MAPIDMGGMDLGHGTTRQDQTAKTWVGRDVQSIIIIWRLIWCMCVQGSIFTLVPGSGGESGTRPGTANSASLLPDFDHLPICPFYHLQFQTRSRRR